MKTPIYIALIIIFSITETVAQNVVSVVSSKGEPVAEAIVKGTKRTAVTDSAGKFDISLFANDSLITIEHVAYYKGKFSVPELKKKKVAVLKEKTFSTDVVKINDDKINDEVFVNIDVKTRAKFSQISDVLKVSAPLFIKDYGGYTGLKTVSFRGLSSENTVVLFNEARVNDLRSGAFDFASLGVNSVDRMIFSEEANYGIISSGGIVKLTAGKPFEKNYLTLGGKYSSINTKSLYGRGGINLGELSATFNFERSFSPNEFPFKFENESLRRANADYDKNFYAGSLIYNKGKIFAKLYAHYSRLENGLPGFVVTNNINSSLARTENKTVLSTFNFFHQISDALLYKATAAYVAQTIEISDSTNELLINRDYERADLKSSTFNNSLLYNAEKLDATIGANLSYDKLNSLSPSFLGDSPYSAERFYQNYFLATNFKLGNFHFIKNIAVNGTASFVLSNETFENKNETSDYFSALGYVKFSALAKNLHFKFSYSKNYRTPTFTELYYSQVFSPDKIQAELYKGFTASAIYEREKFAVKLSYFSIDGDNKIVWTPTRLALQIPRNIKAVSSNGMEFTFKTENLIEGTSFNFIYLYTNAKNVSAQSPDDASYNKFLIYSPQHQIKAMLEYDFDNWFTSLTYSFVSERYYTSDNNPRYVLPAYNVFDFSAGTRFRLFGIKNTLTLNVYNLTDEEYFIIQSYPMPLRTVSLNYSLEIL